MNLVIDIGNTSGKIGLFDKSKLIESCQVKHLEEVIEFIDEFKPSRCVIATTKDDPKAAVDKLPIPAVIFDATLKFPFDISYTTPETLGSDRLAGIAGAYLRDATKNYLVIDFGTCITYDALINNRYVGGSISPGMSMRFKALHTFTGKLPLIEPEPIDFFVGNSTKNAILSGVIEGIKMEVEGIILNYARKFGEMDVIICGGDHKYFENKLKPSIFAAPNLVLEGMNGILNSNG